LSNENISEPKWEEIFYYTILYDCTDEVSYITTGSNFLERPNRYETDYKLQRALMTIIELEMTHRLSGKKQDP
jgi:hypothetical protein